MVPASPDYALGSGETFAIFSPKFGRAQRSRNFTKLGVPGRNLRCQEVPVAKTIMCLLLFCAKLFGTPSFVAKRTSCTPCDDASPCLRCPWHPPGRR